MKTSQQEDQYRIIFHIWVWPGEAYGIDFFKKMLKIKESVGKVTFKNHQKWDDLGVGGSPRAHIRWK